MHPIGNGEKIIASTSDGYLVIFIGISRNSIQLVKKMNLNCEGIKNFVITSQSTENFLDLALCTEQGLKFVTVKNAFGNQHSYQV
jgi:hypothetical protein